MPTEYHNQQPYMQLPISDQYKLTSYVSPFPSDCRLLVKFAFLTRGYVSFNTFVWGEPVNS